MELSAGLKEMKRLKKNLMLNGIKNGLACINFAWLFLLAVWIPNLLIYGWNFRTFYYLCDNIVA